MPVLKAWFESEWPDHYGLSGRGHAERDLLAYANRGSLPVGLVALRDGEPCGFVAIKSESFPTHRGNNRPAFESAAPRLDGQQ